MKKVWKGSEVWDGVARGWLHVLEGLLELACRRLGHSEVESLESGIGNRR